ncbi:hypothetical protein SBOR_0072 [Sclerotinia borealis F-4128]|uniref:Uncharacterized protein n=1 Tax=Sclerotinia borealis (strain F-4128) TaxID=1432307 RepID=W9CRT3_SCLBF|nr:hypothetical protein SBOR_0072 [Sclerotinia borealis F-4128]
MSSETDISKFVDYTDSTVPRIKTDALITLINERDALREQVKAKELFLGSYRALVLQHETRKTARERSDEKLARLEELLMKEGIDGVEKLSDRVGELKNTIVRQRNRVELAERMLRAIARVIGMRS